MLDVLSAPQSAVADLERTATLARGCGEPSFPAWRFTASLLHQADLRVAATTSTSPSVPRQRNKLGSYYCLNRIYDPCQGRFTSPDPASQPSWNLFVYGSGSPVSSIDPNGLDDDPEKEVMEGAENTEEEERDLVDYGKKPDDKRSEAPGGTRGTTISKAASKTIKEVYDKDVPPELGNCLGAALGDTHRYRVPPGGGKIKQDGKTDEDYQKSLDKKWKEYHSFVPKGCRLVDGTGVDFGHSRCKCGEIELIMWYYLEENYDVEKDKPLETRESSFRFHAIGRTINCENNDPKQVDAESLYWRTKLGAGDTDNWIYISDPDKHFKEHYGEQTREEAKKLGASTYRHRTATKKRTYCCKKGS